MRVRLLPPARWGRAFWAAIENETGRFLVRFHFRAHEGAPAGEPELG